VREYLDALRSNKPKRGRKRTPDSITARLAKIDEEIAVADPLDELRLIQERRNLSEELETMSAGIDNDHSASEHSQFSCDQGRQVLPWARGGGVAPSKVIPLNWCFAAKATSCCSCSTPLPPLLLLLQPRATRSRAATCCS
jgi:hypothetical protein